ncbi:uncharacterized protein LOC108336845 [Vigna angularis]|uniref:uncharacterized protein LOC108336845 n=1 Tax=Phaseolus angularis TaxID=3914 RepID=UPI00080A4FFA|nr:uncharacterized protein LOC108336845 [Vigna angularis]
MAKLTQLCIREIVRLHGVPSSIVSNRDLWFRSRFLQSLQCELGSRLHMSFAYHPHINGQFNRTIQSLKDLLRICVLDHLGVWDKVLSLVEFTYNNSYQSSKGRVIRSRKFSLRYIGHCQILRRVGAMAYEIIMPPQLSNLHPLSHVSQLRKYVPNPFHALKVEDVHVRDDLLVEVQPVEIMESQTKQLRGKTINLVKVVYDRRRDDSTWQLEGAIESLILTYSLLSLTFEVENFCC